MSVRPFFKTGADAIKFTQIDTLCAKFTTVVE